MKSKGKNPWPLRIFLIAAALLVTGFVVWYDRTQRGEEPAAAAPAATGEGLTAVFIDVGQGDCVLVGDGSDWILVDAGPPEAAGIVVEELSARGVGALRMVVGTHPHSDHIGGLPAVLEAFAVEALYMPRATYASPSFERLMRAVDEQNREILTPLPGESVVFPGMKVEFLHPPKDAACEDMNDYSVVIRIDSEFGSLLLTGDIGVSVEESIADEYDLETDILKVAHHGSDGSSSAAFIREADPRYAVIQCGIDNDYGMPSGSVLNRLRQFGVSIYRTDRNGTIAFALTREGIIVYTEG